MPERRVLSTTVTETVWLTPGMVRVVVEGADLEGFPVGEFTDHYVKCRFGDKTRSYTVRAFDPGRASHARLRSARRPRRRGPVGGGGRARRHARADGTRRRLHADPDADWHLMVGDDAVLPAIATSLERVPAGVPVFAVLEVEGAEHEQALTSPGDLRISWVHRPGGPGEDPELQLDAVRSLVLPDSRGHAFVHGEATAVRMVRRHLLLERGMPLEDLSVSGYWKLRRTDEQWRAEKPEWKRQAEADLAVQRAG